METALLAAQTFTMAPVSAWLTFGVRENIRYSDMN
jgi:hypothetical protein